LPNCQNEVQVALNQVELNEEFPGIHVKQAQFGLSHHNTSLNADEFQNHWDLSVMIAYKEE
jgi:hypothetical protein